MNYHKKTLIPSLFLTQKTMDSSAKVVPKQCDTLPAGRYLSTGRTPSFSSSSSSLSPTSSSIESFYFHDDTLLSPATPLRFSGVPFSWEHLPGIPKKQNSKKKQESSMKLLPLPPTTTTTTTTTHSSKKLTHEETRIRKKNSIQNSFQRDPFFAALVECSKDDHEETSSSFWNGAKVSRSISDRFGFISLYGSCKRTCAVSESLVYLPSSRRSTYEHVSRRFLWAFCTHWCIAANLVVFMLLLEKPKRSRYLIPFFFVITLIFVSQFIKYSMWRQLYVFGNISYCDMLIQV